MEPLYLPALTGQFSNWRYFQVIMPVQEIVRVIGKQNGKPVYRVRVVSEVEEIYSRKGISNMLQRVFDKKRLEPIKNYLTKQGDRYVNNLTIATFGGTPEWLPIGLSASSLFDIDDKRTEDDWEEFGKSFGIVKLQGNEVLFVLDGQHRVMGLREAVQKDKKLLDQDIAVTLVSHDNTAHGRKKSRRLFTTVNRYAVPVSQGESILLDEDDLSSIIVRELIEKYPKFKKKDLVALNKGANLNLPKDKDKFSTVITLWNINEKLIDHKAIYPKYEGTKKNMVRVRPEDSVIESETKRIFEYWDLFFKLFPSAQKFIEDTNSVSRNDGGPFSLRPIGQQIFVEFYLKVKDLEVYDIKLIKKTPDDLSNEFWHYILWHPQSKTMTGTKAFARDYIFYHLGIPLTANQKDALEANYQKYRKDDQATLPKPKFNK